MFSVSCDLSEYLRDVLEEQINTYETATDVERRIAEIQHLTSTNEMFLRAKKMYKVGSNK